MQVWSLALVNLAPGGGDLVKVLVHVFCILRCHGVLDLLEPFGDGGMVAGGG